MKQPSQWVTVDASWQHAGAAQTGPAQMTSLNWAIRLGLLASAVVSVCIVAWVGWYCRHGIEFADEGFYLVWIANPFKYKYTVTQFGYFYHPLYLAVNESLAGLRAANLIGTLLLAWWVSSLCLLEVYGKAAMSRAPRLIIAAALGTTAFMFLRLWLPTPSYNWLAFQGMLVVAGGMLSIDRWDQRKLAPGAIWIGLGGWMTFLAKPTTAAALAVCVLFYLILRGKSSLRQVLPAIAIALVLCGLTALVLDGSPMAFAERLRRGTEQARMMGAGHTLQNSFRLDNFKLEFSARQSLAWAVMFIGGASFLLGAWNVAARWLGLVIVAAGLVADLAIVLGIPAKPTEFGEFQHLVLLAVPAATLMLLTGLWRKGMYIGRPDWALALAWLMFPQAFAFGTSNNYWWFGGLVGFFWVMAPLVLLKPLASVRNVVGLLLPLAVGAQLIVVTQVHSGMQGPYYQPQPVPSHTNPVDFGRRGGQLLLPPTYAKYVTAAMQTARDAGFAANTPMIDLSGHSPGLLYAIGASNTGQPWLIGNYPGYTGSEQLAKHVLNAVDCEELGAAWVLAEPGGPVSLSASVLGAFGADLTRDYVAVGAFETAPIVGGFTPVKTQVIYRPRRALAQAALECKAERAQ